MRSIDPNIIAQLQSGEMRVFGLVHLNIDSTDFYFTDCDVPLVVAGNRYEPRGIEIGNISYSLSRIVDQATLSIDNLDDYLTSEFVGGTPQGSAVTISMVALKNEVSARQDLVTGLIGYWPLDESSGTNAPDESGNGYDITLYNMEDADWVPGVAGKCLNFDGVNEYGETTTSFGTLSGDTTMCGWFNIDAFVVWSGMGCLSVDGSDYKGWMFTLTSATSVRICAGVPAGGTYEQHTFTVPSMSGDTFILVRHVSDVFYLYVNGVYIDSWSRSVAYHSSGDYFQIGRWRVGYNDYYLNGKIDEVRLYNKALSAAEVAALYNYPSGHQSVTLFQGEIGPWNMVEGKIDITITNQFSQWNQRTISNHSPSCRWKVFKGTECTYSGGETWCDRSYTRCVALGNQANFGGFRWLPSIENKNIWWGQAMGGSSPAATGAAVAPPSWKWW